MVILPIRTPNCFEMENIKVHIRLKLLYQLNWQFSLIWAKEQNSPYSHSRGPLR
jgi:hypothetical protein